MNTEQKEEDMQTIPPVLTVRDSVLTDDEVRALAIAFLTAETPRDRQRRVGASNLSDPCDYCLACAFSGISRETPATGRAWGGRVLGTALHRVLEDREVASLDATSQEARVAWFGQTYPNALIEQHISLGELGTYGEIGTTLDLSPNGSEVIDWKSADRIKSMLLIDYLISVGYGPFAGRTPYAIVKARGGVDYKVSSTVTVHFSANEHAKKMADQAYKVRGYYGQLQLYGLARDRAGHPPRRLMNVFVNRDGNMWWDNPDAEGYNDPTRVHDVWVLSFPYNREQAEAAWNRGLVIWEFLDAGGNPNAFPSGEGCFPCGIEKRYVAPAAEAVAA